MAAARCCSTSLSSVPWRGGVAILGRNGAGKTTLMKAIVGELPLLGGSVSLDARDVGRLPTEQRIRLGLRLRAAGAFGVRDGCRCATISRSAR